MSAESALELTIYRILVTRYCKAASLSVLLYDYLLTLDREISFIWKSNWGIGKVIYILARYSALVDTPWALWLSLTPNASPSMCLRTYIPAIWVAVFGIASAEAILFLRTSALYGNVTKVSVSLFFVWASVLICCIAVTSVYLSTIKFAPSPAAFFVGCFQTAGSRIIYGDYVALLLQETIIVALTIYRAVKTGIHSNDRLVQTLYRDGLFYFLYLLIIAIGNIILLAIGPPALLELIAPFQRVMHAVLSTRVLLHARSAAENKEVTVTDLRFAISTVMHGTPSVANVDPEQQSGSENRTAVSSANN